MFHNAYVQEDLGLLPEDTLLPIGSVNYQSDGTFAMQYGLYSLKEDKFVLPAKYNTISVVDEKKGYYVVNDEAGNHVVDIDGKQIISGFLMGEGANVSKKGDYYWTFHYSEEESKEKYRIYDANFKLVKEFSRDYNENELYKNDGTVYFSKTMFLKHFGYVADSSKEFYLQSNGDGEALFSVYYDGTSMMLDNQMKVLVKKIKNSEDDSVYDVYNNIYSDTIYDRYSSIGLFYDEKGKVILDEKGNSYTNIVGDMYWRSRAWNEYEQILYGVTNHILRIYQYQEKKQWNIDLGDWDSATVVYVYNDIVVVNNPGITQKTRIYKGNTLLWEKEGGYALSPFAAIYKSNQILLESYGYDGQGNNYVLLNDNGVIEYESPHYEKIVSIDDKYIQLERGNYWGVIDYEGNFIIRAIKNALEDD